MREKSPAATRILIVGGGTAGWMAASLMATAWRDRDVEITLLESSDIGVIGVGEATTPKMRHFFERLGFDEADWMPECNATYKCGIRFPGWSTRPGFESYYHPFFTLGDREFVETFFHNVQLRQKNLKVHAHPNVFFVSNLLAEERRAPLAPPGLGYVTEYAYHFDSNNVGALLRRYATDLGVRHMVDTMTRVRRGENGDIAGVETEANGSVDADFFVDCTGFAGLLIGRELEVPFHSDRDLLFNDRAVVIHDTLPQDGGLPSEVYSPALKYGWLWKIPLADRMSNGYVYSSDFCSEEAAEQELRERIGATDESLEARHLRMRIGRRDRTWERNCLALGLSQGFIEPLESTGLFIVQETIESFIERFEQGGFTDRYRDRLNERVRRIFEGVRDYIFMHYKLNSRSDTEYWIANRENDAGKDLLASEFLSVWDRGGDFIGALNAHKDRLVYSHTSWVCILAGMGRYPRGPKKPKPSVEHANLDAVRHNCRYLADRFPDHLALVEQMRQGRGPAGAENRRNQAGAREWHSIAGTEPLSDR